MIENKEINKTFEKYPEYKDSGVEWLGEIPEGWNILPAKRFHKVIKELNTKRQCDNVLSLTLRGVVNNNPDSPEGLVPKDYATYQIFQKNDLVFKLIDLENISTSRVGLVHEKGIMSSAYIRLVIGDNCFYKYAYYFYFSLYKNEVYNKLGSGVRSTLGPNDLLNLSFLKPSLLEEQIAIANFLDNKTSKIDTAIAQKEQMIALLKERKQIIIQNAVTGKWSMVNGEWSMTPREKMKDSGVEWIGEIPEHWEVKKLKYVIKLRHGHQFRDNDFTNSGVKIVKITQLHPEGYLDLSKATYISSKRLPAFKNYMIKEDDVLMCLTGGTIGKIIRVQKVNEPLLQNYRVGHFSSINESVMSNDYMFILLSSKVIEHQILFGMIETGQPNIGMDDMKNMIIVTPNNTDEQNNIVSYINNMSFKIDQAITLQQSEIEKLKEYKATLIDSAVTGKIMVNG